ncbi:peptide-methionine (S)-S-oxide reductase MsrA [Sphingoaurantiacus capsulatus]|uniref:Peptide methionine sulfoxide reductase MsrA n=1 Tax=Sphingoaurantiacus capsulatus TaxID=1771310 RepID=A0ABV7X672_9SPHN
MRKGLIAMVALLTGGAAQAATAVFAGGCFWSTEVAFDKVPGVISTTSGFSGGKVANPSYDRVVSGGTGHLEAVRVVYDPKRVRYAQLLDHYWRSIDPTDPDGQFCDQGASYRTAIFVTADQRVAAEASKTKLAKSGVLPGLIATKILPAAPFYAADASHQDFHVKNPGRYRMYRIGCGRDAALAKVWKKAG